MIKNSILRAKIKRSKITFSKTFLWNDVILRQNKMVNLFLKFDEEILMYYKGKDNYNWILTNKRLFIPSEMETIILSDLIKVDFRDIIENPEKKMMNDKLNLYTKQDSFFIYVEEKTWPLFYDIFSYIVMKNSNGAN